MRTGLSGFGIALLVSVLALGCGGSSKSPRNDAKPSGTPEGGSDGGGDTGPDGGTVTEGGSEAGGEVGGTEGGGETAASPAKLVITEAPTYDFGARAKGSSTDHTFTVTNMGGAPATAVAATGGPTGPFQPKDGTFPGTGGTCTATLAPGASCTFVVTFSPTMTTMVSADVGLSYNDGGAVRTATLSLTGTGAPPGVLLISDAMAYDFGDHLVNTTAEHTFIVMNTGGVAAGDVKPSALAAPLAYKGGTAPGTGGTCGATLAAGASCTLIVTFAPTAPGKTNATLTVSYTDGLATRSATRDIAGQGVQPALVVISDGPTYDFGIQGVGVPATHTFTIENQGGTAAQGLDIMGSLPAPFSLQGGSFTAAGTCRALLTAFSSCTLTVVFKPTATGAASATLTLAYNDGQAAQTATRALAGTGTDHANLAISDGPTYDFGTHGLNQATSHVFTITNTGPVAAKAIAPAALAAPFSLAGPFPSSPPPCTTTLAAGASCALPVTFTPSAVGPASASLGLAYDDGFGAQQNATRALAGTGTNLAFLSVSDGPKYTFPTIATGAAAEHTFVVTNVGLGGATNVAGVALAAPFGYKGGTYPGTAGTCATTLAADATCTVVVTFQPTSPGLPTGTLSITYDDGATSGLSATRALAGGAASPALLAFSNSPQYDYGSKVVGGSIEHVFTVTNVGGFAATAMAPIPPGGPFAFTGGTYPGTGGTCATTLDPGASCTVAVTFVPTAPGLASRPLGLGYSDGASTATTAVNLLGTGLAPALLAISDGPTYDFGKSPVGGPAAEHTFTVTNTGAVQATAINPKPFASPWAFKGGAFPGSGATCGPTLDPGLSCTVTVTFAPVAGGAAASSLSLDYSDGVVARNAAVDLTGVGASPAALTISDGPTYDFGTRAMGASASHTFTVTNGGGVAATSISVSALAAPFAYAGGTYPGFAGTCGATLAAGASCTFVATFSPSAAGVPSGSVMLTYQNGAASASASVGLSGTGALPASLAISDAPTFDFGTRANGSSTDHTFTVTNNGGVPATGILASSLAAPFTYKGGGAYPGAAGTCGGTLAAGASCTVVTNFAPLASGASSSSVGLTYDDGVTGQNASVGLAGTGAAPAALAISDGPSFDFGSRATGSHNQHTFTVSNSGGVSATAMSAGALGTPFSFPGGYPGSGGNCAGSLGAGASCTVVVEFAPTVNGLKTATLTMGYNDGVSATSATRSLTGTGAAPAVLSISDSPTYDYGTHTSGSTTTHTFTVTASSGGGVDATGLSGAALVSPFGYLGSAYPGGGTCGTSLSPGASCTIVVAYAPPSSGPGLGTLSVSYDDGAVGRAVAVNLTGTATPPALLSISDSPGYDFGTLGTTTSTTHVFRVDNSGGSTAKGMVAGALASPYSYAGGAYPGTGGTCTTTLTAGASCAIVVRFAPSSPGTFPGALSVGYNDGANTQSASRMLTGKGTTAAVLAITDWPPQYYSTYGIQSDQSLFDFGQVGVNGTTSHQFFVTNTGSATATAIAGAALGAPFSFAGGSFPGTGGNCPASLPAGMTCAVVVSFHPTTAASSGATLTLSYNDGTTAQNALRPLQGAGTNGPSLAIYDFQTGSNQGVNIGPAWDYGVRGLGVTDDHQFFVVNTGGGTAISITAPSPGPGFGYRGGSYPGTNGNCGTTLAPGASCMIDVAFSPVAVGPASGKILLNYTDTPVTGTFQSSHGVQGVGTNLASLEIWIQNQPFSELVYDYGFHATSTTTGHTFTLVNAGAATATSISSVALPAPYAYAGGTYPGSGGTCGTSLAQQASCTLVVVYAPLVSGTTTATIAVNYDDSSGATRTARRDVTGSATSYALLTIDNWPTGGGGGQQPDPFDFGTSGIPVDHTFALRNVGAQQAASLAGVSPAAPFSFKGGSFPGLGGTCGMSLAVNASCTVVVTYSGATTGASAWSATYLDGSGGTATATRAVTGSSISTALLQITDCDQCGADSQPADFGTTGTASQRTFYVRNVGSVSATAIAAAPMGDGFSYGSGGTFPGPGGTCGTTLASGAVCTIGIVFSPPSPGGHGSTLNLGYNDGASTQSAQRQLTGTGISTALLTVRDWTGGGGGSNPQPYDYGSTGVATDHIFTVTNDGAQPAANVHAGPGLGNGFNYKGGTFPGTGGTCSTSLAVGVSCNIVVTFTPPGTGIFSSTIKVEYLSNGTGPILAAFRDVTGTGISTALLIISPWGPGGNDTQPYDYGSFGSPTDHTFYVTNVGAISATALADAGTLGGDFGYPGGYPGAGGDCGTSLAKGVTCMVVARFSPTGSGPKASTLTLKYNDGGNPNAQVAKSLLGTAVSGPLLRIYDWTGPGGQPSGSPPPFDYGTWGVAVYHTFTVTNDGNAPAANMADGGTLGGNFSYEGGAGYPGTNGGNCGTSLAAGSSCNITVVFTPTSSGPRSSKITINYTDSASVPQTPVTRDIMGTATTGALLSLWDAFGGGCGEGCGPYSYGSISVGSTGEAVFNIANNGAATATLMGDGGQLALPFKYKGNTYPGTGGNCGSMLASNNQCSIVVVFAPLTVGSANSQVTVNYNDGLGNTLNVHRSLSGTGTP